MKIVIQCAGRKNPDAGYFLTSGGEPVCFVADPEAVPTNKNLIYARPDDQSDKGQSWRELLLDYNSRQRKINPFGLYPAYQLYSNKTYEGLVGKFGIENVYILSAGWGLIRSDFLTPQYDITFSQSAEPFNRRKERDVYQDFSRLMDNEEEIIVFCGGKSYIPLFCTLTDGFKSKRIVFYKSKSPPKAPGCETEKYETDRSTTWHYEFGKALIDGKVSINKD